ncbi:hypothetical protein BH09SUM1_BH09SUM1_02190 [soil metagenome]
MKKFLRETDEFFSSYVPPMTRRLLYLQFLGVILFKLTSLEGLRDIGQRILVLTPYQAILRGHVWQFFTYQFTNELRFENILWALFYMIIIVSFGAVLENQLGARRYGWLIVLNGLAAGMVHCGLAFALKMPEVPAYGFRGGILMMLTLTTIWFPRMPVNLMGFIPLQMRIAAAITAIILAFDLLQDMSQMGRSIGLVYHAIDFGSIAFGVLVAYTPRVLSAFDNVNIPGRKRKGRVVPMSMGHPGRHTDPDDRYNDPHWKLDQ